MGRQLIFRQGNTYSVTVQWDQVTDCGVKGWQLIFRQGNTYSVTVQRDRVRDHSVKWMEDLTFRHGNS